MSPSILIVTGLSGSGKTVALNTLEDLGYYCTDNLPARLLESYLEHVLDRPESKVQRVALGIDARAGEEDLSHVADVIGRIKQKRGSVEVWFLTATDRALIRRYSETRRPHPLAEEKHSLPDVISRERTLLSSLHPVVTEFIDTSELNIYQLRRRLAEIIGTGERPLSLLIESFAYKRGVPADVDFAFDVRNLPNPHWEQGLRDLTGRDKPVAQYLAKATVATKMVQSIQDFITTYLPSFESSSRSYLTIGIGCTGGRHRSVFVAEQLYAHFRAQREHVLVYHREL